MCSLLLDTVPDMALCFLLSRQRKRRSYSKTWWFFSRYLALSVFDFNSRIDAKGSNHSSDENKSVINVSVAGRFVERFLWS
jgi:hypothetical protein